MNSHSTENIARPRFRLHSPAVDFVENRLPQYHPAFDNPHANLNPALCQFVNTSHTGVMHLQPYGYQPSQPIARPLPPGVEIMEFWNFVFPDAMAHLTKLEEPYSHSNSEYSIRGLHKWTDIRGRLDSAKRVYDFQDAKSTLDKGVSKVRRGIRKGMDKSVAPLQQAARFVPDVDIANPIVGAVKVLLDAYKNAAKTRDIINDGFGELSNGKAFIDIDFYVTKFPPKDPNITQASMNLVVATLKTIEHAIGFYISYQIKRGFSVVFGGDTYQERLKDSLDEVKKCSLLLKEEGAKSEFNYNDWSRRQDRIESAKMLCSLDAMNHFLFLIDERQRRLDEVISRACTPQPFIQNAHIYTPEHIWKLLHVPKLDEADMLHTMSRAGSFLFEDRGRAEQLIGTRQFGNWVLDQNMNKLLVHGDFETENSISPFSVLCTSLIQALRPRSGLITLVFFCGCHLKPHDEYPGPMTMIRSFIAQILEQHPFTPDNLANEVNLDGVEAGDIPQLCKLFACLARQLPATTTVFCIIDGVQFYERDQYWKDMDEVLCCLFELAEDDDKEMRATLKILLTSPKPTRRVRKVFDIGTSLLTMAAIPRGEQSPSQRRFERELTGSGLLE